MINAVGKNQELIGNKKRLHQNKNRISLGMGQFEHFLKNPGFGVVLVPGEARGVPRPE